MLTDREIVERNYYQERRGNAVLEKGQSEADWVNEAGYKIIY